MSAIIGVEETGRAKNSVEPTPKVEIARVDIGPETDTTVATQPPTQLRGSMIFRKHEIDTDYGRIRFGISRALLRLKCTECEMPQRYLGFSRVRYGEQNHSFESSDEKKSGVDGEFGGEAGISLAGLTSKLGGKGRAFGGKAHAAKETIKTGNPRPFKGRCQIRSELIQIN